jgi:hypothetical protein
MAAHFTKMVSLARTKEDREKEKERFKEMAVPASAEMEYPPGCCISLTDEVLDKLEIGKDDMPDVGDTIHLCLMAKVTSVSDGQFGRRVELQVLEMACEDEDQESESMSSEERADKRYGKKDAA